MQYTEQDNEQSVQAEHAPANSIPAPAANGDVRLIWKLKGTGKKTRRRVIEECVKGQPVFIICDSNGTNCMVITEEGEEIGRLNDRDSKTYHAYVEKHPYHIYIKRIRFDMDKPRVKILLIVHQEPPYPLNELHAHAAAEEQTDGAT